MSWRYYITRKRFIIIFIVSFLILDLYILYNYAANKAKESQRATVNSKYEQLRDNVSRLPNPEKLSPGLDSETTEAAVKATNEQSEKAKQIAIQFNCNTRDYFVLPTRCSNIGNSTAIINKELEQYARVVDSMQYLITFNPKFFTLKYEAGTAETEEKMQKLETGLNESKVGLENLREFKERDEMLEIIKAVINSKERLKQTNETQPFELLVEKVQEEVIKKLTEYYKSTVEEVRNNAQSVVKTISN